MADLARRGHRQPESTPSPPPNKVNQLLSGPLTAPPRPAKGDLRIKGGNLATRPGVRWNHRQPNAGRYPGRISSFKILGDPEDRGGVFRRDLSGDNGIDEILGLGSGALIKHRGAYRTLSAFSSWGRGERGRGTGQAALGGQAADLAPMVEPERGLRAGQVGRAGHHGTAAGGHGMG